MFELALFIAGCNIFIQNAIALEAIVVLKTTDAVNIKALKNVAGVTAVYRVQGHAFYSPDGKGWELNHQWDYAVVGSGLKDAAAQDAMMEEVSGMDFVELFAGYRMGRYPDYDAKTLNDFIKHADPKHFVKRPMKPVTPKPDCYTMHLKKGERLLFIEFVKINDLKAAAEMGKEVLLKAWSALGVSYKYIGSVSSSRFWEQVQILDFHDAATYCEYEQSQFATDLEPTFVKAIKRLAGAFAVEV